MKKSKQRTQKLSLREPNLYELLQTLPDFRRRQGRMHSLSFVLLMCIMAMMSGCLGQRAIADFVKRHRKELLKTFKPFKGRLPSYPTIMRVIVHTDFQTLSSLFSIWAKHRVHTTKGTWVAIDGKAIGGTLQNPGTPYQRFTSLVSFFSHVRKQVIAQSKVHTKSNEIPLVQQLLKELDLEDCVLTLDALHCQKATTKAIIASKNDYVIGVKENQPILLKTLKKRANIHPQLMSA